MSPGSLGSSHFRLVREGAGRCCAGEGVGVGAEPRKGETLNFLSIPVLGGVLGGVAE